MIAVLPAQERHPWTFLAGTGNQHLKPLDSGLTTVRLIRGVVLRDVEIVNMGFDVYWLALFTLGGLAVASLRFKKSLD